MRLRSNPRMHDVHPMPCVKSRSYTDTIFNLADQLECDVHICHTRHHAYSDLHNRYVYIPDPTDITSAAIALHELGHIHLHCGAVRPIGWMLHGALREHVIEQEFDAWIYAEVIMRSKGWWCSQVEQLAVSAIASYEKACSSS